VVSFWTHSPPIIVSHRALSQQVRPSRTSPIFLCFFFFFLYNPLSKFECQYLRLIVTRGTSIIHINLSMYGAFLQGRARTPSILYNGRLLLQWDFTYPYSPPPPPLPPRHLLTPPPSPHQQNTIQNPPLTPPNPKTGPSSQRFLSSLSAHPSNTYKPKHHKSRPECRTKSCKRKFPTKPH
jgi:hypothetical protein